MRIALGLLAAPLVQERKLRLRNLLSISGLDARAYWAGICPGPYVRKVVVETACRGSSHSYTSRSNLAASSMKFTNTVVKQALAWATWRS